MNGAHLLDNPSATLPSIRAFSPASATSAAAVQAWRASNRRPSVQ